MEGLLYKYLDITGAKKMLADSTLQFTNTMKLNDPFDCHPGLWVDFSNPYGRTNEYLHNSDKVRVGRMAKSMAALAEHKKITERQY